MTEPRPLSPTARTTLGRKKDRAATDRRALHDVLDEGLVCHLGLVTRGAPMVLPTGYGRDGETLYLHGSSGARSLITVGEGAEVCVTVTLLDAIVYARSLNNHSMNYRSAVVFGTARRVVEHAEKEHGLRVITEHLAPGSWDHARLPNTKEMASVTVIKVDLAEASVKARTGPPGDDEEDIAADAAWAGLLPVRTSFGAPVPGDDLPAQWTVPDHVTARGR